MLRINFYRFFRFTCNGKYLEWDIDRFISKIKINKETGCWEYMGALIGGYGGFKCRRKGIGKMHKAHRISWELFYGKLILEGMCVCHHCDNKKCCNPFHLFLGTTQENTKDRDNKGRQARQVGEKCGTSKLTWVKVSEIRRLYATGNYTCKQLGKLYSISLQNINYIINNKKWYDPNYTIPDFRLLRQRTNSILNKKENVNECSVA